MRVPEHFDAPVGGRFLIEQQVGAGATAHVYKAIDLVLQRPVALKLFTQWDPERTDHPAAREAELLRSLDHPGIVKIWEDGILADLGVPFLALEWLAAGSLRDFAARQQPSIRQLVELGARCANALGALHAAGIVHRDLKPENILLRPVRGADGRGPELLVEPVLVDFGVATRGAVGTLSGTPAYMSPEQARGVTSLDGRSDLYSLGSTLFELLVGRPPHRGPTAIATLARLATTPAPRASLFRPELPRALDDLLVALLSTDSAERPASAAEVESQLLSCLEENDDPYVFPEEPSSRLGSGSSRLVTTIVATAFAASATRDQALHLLLSQGAEAAGLGSDALVGHLGVQGATGREAQAALELGGQLAGWGAAVGIASGRAELRQRAGNGAAYPVGDVVDRAAALAREASPAQVLADATTAELGRGRHEFRLRGDGSSVVGAALRTPLGDGRGGAPFVGREAELARVLGAYERTLSSRRSVLVTVSAEPGMGKSRLQREAVARLSALANPPRIVVQRSDPYGRRHALGAASDLLASMIELPRGASAQQATLAIQETLGPSTLRDGQGEHQLLSRLLANEPLPQSIGPNGARDALWLSMTELAREALRDGPLVFVVEDLQWADPESILWLDHLLGREAEHGALLLACVRPEFWSDYGARFQQRERVRIDLRPLSNQASRSIAAAVLGAAPTDERVT
ncbi:MAG TPA: protein kinase, partial [Polyangiaceae bacterium]|nr:protein kinase [Polyangiaceae bacterium]